MKDYIVRATAANAQIRAFAASTTELVEEARTRHAGAVRRSDRRDDSDSRQ